MACESSTLAACVNLILLDANQQGQILDNPSATAVTLILLGYYRKIVSQVGVAIMCVAPRKARTYKQLPARTLSLLFRGGALLYVNSYLRAIFETAKAPDGC